jgi:hypothetical protein
MPAATIGPTLDNQTFSVNRACPCLFGFIAKVKITTANPENATIAWAGEGDRQTSQENGFDDPSWITRVGSPELDHPGGKTFALAQEIVSSAFKVWWP